MTLADLLHEVYVRVFGNWKSSLAGILSTFVAMTAAGFFAPNPFINTKVSGYAFAASGMARIVLGLITKDTKGN
jgi:uncharacterized membrane protein HdeD (DUF308 family)